MTGMGRFKLAVGSLSKLREVGTSPYVPRVQQRYETFVTHVAIGLITFFNYILSDDASVQMLSNTLS
jgi:hypothetical protein